MYQYSKWFEGTVHGVAEVLRITRRRLHSPVEPGTVTVGVTARSDKFVLRQGIPNSVFKPQDMNEISTDELMTGRQTQLSQSQTQTDEPIVNREIDEGELEMETYLFPFKRLLWFHTCV